MKKKQHSCYNLFELPLPIRTYPGTAIPGSAFPVSWLIPMRFFWASFLLSTFWEYSLNQHEVSGMPALRDRAIQTCLMEKQQIIVFTIRKGTTRIFRCSNQGLACSVRVLVQEGILKNSPVGTRGPFPGIVLQGRCCLCSQLPPVLPALQHITHGAGQAGH